MLPFNDKLLELIDSVFPNSFKLDHVIDLAKRFSNIILPKNFHKLYDELQIFEENLKNFQCLFSSYQNDVTKFYLDDQIQTKFPFFTQLSATLLHSHIQQRKLKDYSLN